MPKTSWFLDRYWKQLQALIRSPRKAQNHTFVYQKTLDSYVTSTFPLMPKIYKILEDENLLIKFIRAYIDHKKPYLNKTMEKAVQEIKKHPQEVEALRAYLQKHIDQNNKE
uniref:Uncharacterized protein n=1 Tax=Monomastix sp. (strain OKE-1) TaxID=141716 RepID=U5YGD7_MONSK|nr:hypothetical protein [Monomastix sp. OKE-1]AGZ90180.1 hypothetical protein [Monomastix sp. OKE-1]